MAKKKTASPDEGRLLRSGAEELEEAQAQKAGAEFEWHFGRVTRMGHFEMVGEREVTIVWDEGGVTSQQGNISDEQWDIFKLAFLTSGRIATLSDMPDSAWMYDYGFLEAVR